MARLVANVTFVKLNPYINPREVHTHALEFAPNQTIARGTIISQITATGKAAPYASANSDGTQTNIIGPLAYDIVVDANGYITYGPTGSVSDLTRGAEKTAPVYWKGDFLDSELVGLDSNAISLLKARYMGIGAAFKFLHIP